MRRCLLGVGLVALVAATTSCGGEKDPVRVAVQVDCQGVFSSYGDAELAGAFLPLIERGARLAGPSPSAGLVAARVAGRPVDVKVACTETAESTFSAPQLRRLLDEWQPDVVVGSGITGQDGIVVRDLGKRYPGVTFFVTVPAAQQITLFDPAPNVYRFNHDNAQSVAGLATYAYRTLGWRRTALVVTPYPDDWEEAAGFLSEFCALGGIATRDDGRAAADPAGAARRYSSEVDGVAVFSSYFPPAAFMRAMSQRPEDVSKRMVLGGWAFDDPSNLVLPGVDLEGVAVVTTLPRGGGSPTWRRYLASFAKTYPGLPPAFAAGQLVVPYRNGMEAFASALERAAGELGDGGSRLRKELEGAALPTVPTPMTVDRNGQAVVATHLSLIGPQKRGIPTARAERVVRGIDQAYGGIFGPPHNAPTAETPACDNTATPPSWAG